MRALAVTTVVLAHALVPGFAGGYVGVDVFFVISGFLICRLLFAEMEDAGRVGLARFWARRVRRLLPNATLTLLATLAAAAVVIPGFMRVGVASDVIMSALQVSNYHFSAKALDYFRQDDPQSPVLHFWSLAVEEQFYLVWPPLLALICLLLGKRALTVSRLLLILVIVFSFAGMMKAIHSSQPVAFFHSWARAWQLGLGGLLAIAFNAGVGLPGTRIGDSRGLQALIHCLGWLGLCAILAATHLLSESSLYPGLAALAPTLGAAAMIASITLVPQAAWSVSVPLSTSLPRWLGARSYSWYLWHWPMLILLEFAYPALPAVRALGAFAALGVASVVYAYIEDPIRRGKALAMSPKRTIAAGLASMLLIVGAGLIFARLPAPGGSLERERDARMQAAIGDLGTNYADKCHLDVEVSRQPECEYGVRDGRRRVVLFGDSHAAQRFSAVQKAALAEGWSFRSWTKSSCPSIDVQLWYPPRRAAFHECDAWRESVMQELTGPDRPDLVVLSNLQDYTDWIVKPDGSGKLLRKAEAVSYVKAGALRIVNRLVDAGVAVVIVRDTPRMIRSIAPCYVGGGGSVCDLTRERAQPRPWIDVEVARSVPDPNVHLLDLTDEICEPQVCRIERGGEVIWRDSNHVRSSFASKQSEHFARVLRQIEAKGAK